ncbi:MAG: hypothetical protein GF401_04320 [Chitinivibrionales bacterium]|nr:hypothetical protein [Chitinivibrionales bacterium]
MPVVVEYFKSGGIFMYPILIGTLWGLTIIIERIIFFLQTAFQLNNQSRKIEYLLKRGEIAGIEAYLKAKKGIIKNVLKAGLENRSLPDNHIEMKMEEALLKDIPAYEKYLDLLATLSHLMPIFGLLGTVSGMIATFRVLAAQGTADIHAMADGISVALITTQAGLIASVPIILGHTLLSIRLKKVTDKTKEVSMHFLYYIKVGHA